jgi:hypothetical protein
MVLLELPKAPDWSICWQMLWLTLALPPAPPLAKPPPTLTLPAPPAPPVAVPVSVALCEAELLVLSCAAALCVAENPIAVDATTAATTAVITNSVLFIYIRILYNKNKYISVCWRVLINIYYFIIIVFI